MDVALQIPGGFEFLGILVAACVASLVALILVALWMYRDAQSRAMDATVWLVLLIIATLFGGIVGLVIVVVVYLVVRGNHPVGGIAPTPYGMYPAGPYAAPVACPVCGVGMTWVPQYQRWYCPTCGQYR